MCKIADIVVVGGVRRSAMISLFDCTDERMSKSKFGAWWNDNPQRALANNSAVYENRKPDVGFFMKKWLELYDSKSGEPGFFSRAACQRIAARNGRRDIKEIALETDEGKVVLKPFDKVLINGKEGYAYELEESDDFSIL
jgi:ribonucleoside-diphosphate reductase alpha chain